MLGRQAVSGVLDYAGPKNLSICAASEEGGRTREPTLPVHAVGLIANSSSRVTLVVAPTGFGKTVLLHEIRNRLRSDGVAVACLASGDQLCSLGEADGATSRTVTLIDDGDCRDSAWLKSLIEGALERDSRDKLVICLQSSAHLDISSWLLNDEFELYRTRDLAFTERETYNYLHMNGISGLTVSQISDLQEMTDGWPAAIRIARDYFGAKRTRSNFGDLKHHLTTVLGGVLQRSLTPELRALLAKVAAFDRFNKTLLADLCGGQMSPHEWSMLEGWCFPAGGNGNYLRLHGLVRDWARVCANANDYGEVASLKTSISWFCKKGMVEDAIDYALREEDWSTAQQLLARHSGQLVQETGAIVRFLEWVEKLEYAGQAIDPETNLWRCWALVFNLRLDEATKIAERLACLQLGRAEKAHLEKLNVSIHARKGDPESLAEQAEGWLSDWKDDFPFHAAAVATLASLARYALSDPNASRSHLWDARRYAAKSGSWYARAWVLGVEALYVLEAGQPDLALQLVSQALDLVPDFQLKPKTLADTLSLIQAAAHLERGDRDLAHALVLKGIGSWNHHGLVETSVLGSATMALVLEDVQGQDNAIAELRRYPVCEGSIEFAHSLISAHLFIRAERTSSARAEYEHACSISQKLRARAPRCLASMELLHCEAWLLFSEGLTERARTACKKVISYAKDHGKGRLMVSALLLHAGILFRMGDLKQSESVLRRAIQMTTQNRLADTFVRHKWAVEKLVGQVLAQMPEGSVLPYVADACSEIRAANDQSTAKQAIQEFHVEPLTERELDVLKMLDSCMSAKSISQEMDISLATLKWHIQNIYSKLSVNNRSGALHIARECCLI